MLVALVTMLAVAGLLRVGAALLSGDRSGWAGAAILLAARVARSRNREQARYSAP